MDVKSEEKEKVTEMQKTEIVTKRKKKKAKTIVSLTQK